MSRNSARARVHRAQLELDAAEQQLATQWQPWHERIGRHKLFLLISGGLLGGMALAAVPPKRWARVGAALFGGSAWLAHSAIGPAVFGALWTKVQRSDSTRAPSASPVSPST